MSEPIPESVPTSSHRSGRPAKRMKATDAASQQSSQVEALFANPNQLIETPIGPRAKTLAPPPEIVANVQGSSAGAGSGEFHVYKAARRREYERLRAMDEEVQKEKADLEWEQRREEARRKDEEKLSKNRARREKLKARQAKAKAGSVETDENGAMKTDDGKTASAGIAKKKLGPAKVSVPDTAEEDGDGSRLNGVLGAEENGIIIHEDD